MSLPRVYEERRVWDGVDVWLEPGHYMDLILVAQIDTVPQVHGHDRLQLAKLD